MNIRNHPCACGSGKKTKRCCGSEAEKSRRTQEYLAKLRTPPPPPEDASDHADTGTPLSPRLRRTSTLPLIFAAAALMDSGRR